MVHGLEFTPAEFGEKVSLEAYRRGLLVETSGPRDEVVKLLPPLTVSDAELDQGLRLLADAVETVCAPAATVS